MKTPDISRIVDSVLHKAKIITPPVPALAIARSYGINVKVGPLPDDLSGFLLHENERAFIGVNSRHAKTRQTFTLAHELGHFLLHPSANFVDRKLIYFRDTRSAEAIDIKEMQANQFAAELLMPHRFVHRFLEGKKVDIEDDAFLAGLAHRFGVSVQALTFRLTNLNLAGEAQNTRRYAAA